MSEGGGSAGGSGKVRRDDGLFRRRVGEHKERPRRLADRQQCERVRPALVFGRVKAELQPELARPAISFTEEMAGRERAVDPDALKRLTQGTGCG